MSKETRLGIFAIVILSISIWGYSYLKGKNMLSPSQIFYAEYLDIGELMVSSPVKINGFQVGTVSKISLKKTDMRTIVVEMLVEKGIQVPREAVAVIEPQGVMGGAQIALTFTTGCQDDSCAPSGSMLAGRASSLMGKMLAGADFDSYLDKFRAELAAMMDTLNQASADPNARDLVGQSLYDTRQILHHTRMTTEQLNALVSRMGGQLQAVMGDLQAVTGTIKKSNAEISGILANTHQISEQVRDADLGKTIADSRETMESLQTTLEDLRQVTDTLSLILDRVNQGDGTLGKLINDPEVYHNLVRTSRQVDLLLQDVRLNPKRYINVSVFGGRSREYKVPEADPAFPAGGQ